MKLFLVGMLLLLAAMCCSSLKPTRPEHLVKTPYGIVHRECVLAVDSGSAVTALADGIRINHANGTVEHRGPCAHEPRAMLQNSGKTYGNVYQKEQRQDANVDASFYQHFWFGMTWIPNQDITNISASWLVPNRPQDTNPYGPYSNSPTESWWIGIQDNGVLAVLQPVIEINDLDPSAFDAASWNCCPSGYTVHSTPLQANPGDQVEGSIAQTNPGQDSYIYNIVTQVNGNPTSLYADMTGLSGWTPYVAQAIYEAYFVATCDQLTSSDVEFNNLQVATTSGVQNGNFQQFFVTTQGGGPVPCYGSTSYTGYDTIQITFNT